MAKEFLAGLPIFYDLGEEQLARLTALATEEHHPANRQIFREGDPVDALYLVREGSVTVYRDTRGKPLQLLARLDAGAFFGEMGLLNKSLRQASARTSQPSVLIKVAKAGLLDLLADNPGLELKFRAEIIRRHGMNVSALLGLAGQRDVRIRLGVEAQVRPAGGEPLRVILENLSLGGVALSGLPEEGWQTGELVHFGLGRRGEEPMLEATGKVSWREGDDVGVAFEGELANDTNLIHRVLRRFLEGRS